MRTIHIIFSLLCAVLILSKDSYAQVGTMKWQFKSRSEVNSALQKTRGNLRKTYEVLVCAGRQGFCNSSIAYYEKLVVGHNFDATYQDSAAYAFAYDIGYSYRPWSWKIDPNQSIVKNSSRTTVAYFRDRAAGLRPLSPEILVMRSVYESTTSDRKEAYQHALQATKLSPDWADAQYWLAWAAKSYGLTFNKDVHPVVKKASSKTAQIQLGKVAIQAYSKAEKLDPALSRYLYIEKIGAYRLIADKQSAQKIPVLLDNHLRSFPLYAAWYEKAWGKDEQQLRQMYADIASDISKNATS